MRKTVKRVVSAVAVLTAATSAAVVPATSASAEVYKNQGFRCQGDKAVRCAWVNVDSTNNRARAYGSLVDRTSSTDYVSITVCLLENGGGPCNSAHGRDSVQTHTPLASCENGKEYKAVVHWNWNNGQGHGTWYSAPLHFNVC